MTVKTANRGVVAEERLTELRVTGVVWGKIAVGFSGGGWIGVAIIVVGQLGKTRVIRRGRVGVAIVGARDASARSEA